MTGFSGNVAYAPFWPPEFIAKEADSLARSDAVSDPDGEWFRQVQLLLGQAFTSPAATNAFLAIAADMEPHDDFGDIDPRVLWLRELTEAAHNRSLGPRPYHSKSQPVAAALPLWETSRHVRALVEKLRKDGFFDEAFGVPCPEPDSSDGWKPTPTYELDRLVGKGHLWTADPEYEWGEADLFDFIEVFHDLAARPTRAWFCHYCDELHPWEFSAESGQSLYRALVNQLLDRSTVELRIAEAGKDVGRMVQAAPDEMGKLIEEALDGQSPDHDEISQAVAMFRHRDGTVEQRRLAIVALAGILEGRRQFLKDKLLSRDENALFQIANQFSLRHKKGDQRDDYDPEFLDWIFYWYLATINLADRLLAKRAEPDPAPANSPVSTATPGCRADEEPF